VILHITDQADEFRISISGPFMDSSVSEAGSAWEAALLANKPRRISVDITRMSCYDHPGYRLLRNMHIHGTHIVAGTPKSLQFFNQISGPLLPHSEILGYDAWRANRRPSSSRVFTMQPRAAAAGE